ncbi:MAG: 3-dehydroquinate synthase [Alphaproteobacteria bacterium]|nr:3-dehydroquinate synthase [Alphaproteobacteria bacterium]
MPDSDPDPSPSSDPTAASGGAPIHVPIELGARSYDVVVGAGLIATAGRDLSPLLRRRRAVILTDRTVAGLWLPALERALADAGIACESIVVRPGEGAKSFGVFEEVLERLLTLGVERGDCLLALGGGVIGDLTGFAASVLRRGVPFVQIPTTLLAQVDSSVGGKTAINARAGKNLIGTFHQPRRVLADTGALATLPEREMKAGYAEVVKYGLLGDAAFFAWLEAHGRDVLARVPGALTHAVATSVRAKAAIVAADEHETGARALLNLGHTFGHALEAETGYSDRLLHGEGVAIGMALAFRLSEALGLAPPGEAARVTAHLAACGLPASLRDVPGTPLPADRLLAHMAQDKKVDDGRITFILARRIGEAVIERTVPLERVRDLLLSEGAGA